MAEAYPGLHFGMLPVPVGSNPAGQRLCLGACIAQGRILFGLNPQKQTVFSGTERPSKP